MWFRPFVENIIGIRKTENVLLEKTDFILIFSNKNKQNFEHRCLQVIKRYINCKICPQLDYTIFEQINETKTG